MRSIKDDLESRVLALDSERQKLLARLQEIDHIKANLNQVLRAEKTVFSKRKNGKIRVSTIKASHQPKANGTPLLSILADLLADKKIHTLAELSKGAEDRGYSFGEKAPGRVLHFALLNMSNNGRVDRTEDGGWKLKS